MNDPDCCRGCGAKRPADAPSGLCPACLLKAGLLGEDSQLPDVTITFGPASSSVLASFGEAFGKIPAILLRDADSATDPGPVIRPSSPEMPDPAERSARLQLFGEIARGGMGAVFKGRDTDLGRDLAVKILLESHRDKPEMIRRFIEEAQIAGQLQHPGIVPIYELGAFGDRRPYFAMKLVKGRTLAELLGERGRVSAPSSAAGTPGANATGLASELPRFLSIFESICQTMAYAHARGVIHRDLKPSNVMVGSFGEVQVMDWGLAKVLPRGGAVEDASAGHRKDQGTVIATARSGSDSDLSHAGSIMGTPSYMAPEQARGEVDQVDERADVFALGSIPCELLTSEPAFTGRNSGEIQRKASRGEVADAITRLDQNSFGHDAELISLAKSSLASERDDRPRNAGEVAERMGLYHARVQDRLRQSEIARAEEKARAEEATKRVAVERQRRRLTVALAASLLGFLVLAGSGGFWIYRQRQSRLAALDATLTRIQALRDQAAPDGADSPRRYEALAVADQALASLGDMARSDRGQSLSALRDGLSVEQERADRGQRLLAELESVRPWGAQLLEQWEIQADRTFSLALRRYKLDLDTTNSDDAIRELKKLPPPIVRGLVSNLDRWLVIRHDRLAESTSNAAAHPLHRILALIKGLDPDPERNRMRALFLDKDLKPRLQSLRDAASHQSLLDLGPEIPVLLSRLLTRAGDSESAIGVLRSSVLRYPGDLWTNLDLAYQNQNNTTEAVRYFTAARALEPQMGADLAEMLSGSGRDEEALAILRELARIDPDNLSNGVRLTMLLMKAGKTNEARISMQQMNARLSEAIRRTPDDVVAHGRRAVFSLLASPRDYESAIVSFREVSRLDPNDSESRYWLGLLLRKKGDLQDSIKEFREAIRLSPSNPEYHSGLASALRQANDYKGEIAELREAIHLEEPNLREASLETRPGAKGLSSSIVSRVVGELGSYIHGMIDGRHYLLGGGFERSSRYKSLASALAGTGDYNGAMAVYRGAIKSHSERTELYEGLAELLEKQGKAVQSIVVYREAIKAHPEIVELHQGLGTLLERQGKTDESIAVYREAIKAHPEIVELHQGLANLLERHGRTEESNTEVDQVISLLREQLRSKEESWLLQRLGMAYLRRSRPLEAAAQFRRAIELHPNQSNSIRNEIAWELATNQNPKLRDGTLAVEFATKACELTEWKNPAYLDTLAAAHAESGEFDQAVKWQSKAIELLTEEKEKADYRTRLKLYREKKPYHTASP